MINIPKDPFGFKPVKIKGLTLEKKKKRTLGKRDRDILFKRAKGICEGCGKRIRDSTEMQVGHKRAYSKGGATTLANSVCLCYGCNKMQGTDSFATFKKKLEGTYGKRTKKVVRKKKVKKESFNFFKTRPF